MVNASAPDGPDGVTLRNGIWKYTVNDAFNTVENVNGLCNTLPASSCPFRAQFLQVRSLHVHQWDY